MALIYKDYAKTCEKSIGRLTGLNYEKFNSLTWISFIKHLQRMGPLLPIRQDTPQTLNTVEIVTETITNIMDSDLATIRLLRRMSGIFLVRVYIGDRLINGLLTPETTYTIIGEKYQVAFVRSLMAMIHKMYVGFSKNQRFLILYLGKEIQDKDKETARRHLLKAMLNVLSNWPSFRPKNPNHPHELTPKVRSQVYNKYELRMFYWIYKRYRFYFENKDHDPGNYTGIPIVAPWKVLSDVKVNIPGYISLQSRERLIKQKLLWPGLV